MILILPLLHLGNLLEVQRDLLFEENSLRVFFSSSQFENSETESSLSHSLEILENPLLQIFEEFCCW